VDHRIAKSEFHLLIVDMKALSLTTTEVGQQPTILQHPGAFLLLGHGLESKLSRRG
jgi:hypothetical protein